MDTHRQQQSESKKYKSKDPSDIIRRQQNTLMRRLEKEEKARKAAMPQRQSFDPYRDVGRAPAQVPGSITGPRMPGYEFTGRGYTPKKRDEALAPVNRAQVIKTLLGEMLTLPVTVDDEREA